jgi:hypothetical protein
MRNKNAIYKKVLKWINDLPTEQEFLLAEAQQATGVKRQSLQSTIPPLCKNDIMKRREVNVRTIFYSKGSEWNLEKAIEANHQRLSEKWYGYLIKKWCGP